MRERRLFEKPAYGARKSFLLQGTYGIDSVGQVRNGKTGIVAHAADRAARNICQYKEFRIQRGQRDCFAVAGQTGSGGGDRIAAFEGGRLAFVAEAVYGGYGEVHSVQRVEDAVGSIPAFRQVHRYQMFRS